MSDKRCDLMVDRSIVVLEEGKITGSRMIVYMRGSDRSAISMSRGIKRVAEETDASPVSNSVDASFLPFFPSHLFKYAPRYL